MQNNNHANNNRILPEELMRQLRIDFPELLLQALELEALEEALEEEFRRQLRIEFPNLEELEQGLEELELEQALEELELEEQRQEAIRQEAIRQEAIRQEEELEILPQNLVNAKKQQIIAEFTRLIGGEIEAVNIPGGCSRVGIQTMIETVLNFGEFDKQNLYNACEDRFANYDTVQQFLENLADYATVGLGRNNRSDINITQEQLLQMIRNTLENNPQQNRLINLININEDEVEQLDVGNLDTDEGKSALRTLLGRPLANILPKSHFANQVAMKMLTSCGVNSQR
jgi:hypothetical protein